MQTFFSYAAQSLKEQYRPEEIRQLSYALLEDCCGFSKNDIYAGKDTEISTKQRRQLHEKLGRLAEGEPLQYITGVAYFYDLKLSVNPTVLIPRPETEELVEWIINDNKGKTGRILDVGTGSACISLALAKHLPGMQVEAWDISPDALALARKNAADLGLDVAFIEQDLFRFNPGDRAPVYDVIVSNPPYVTTAEALKMERRVLEHEPALAMFVPDNDALIFYRALAALAARTLKPGGSLYVEISIYFGGETVQLFEEAGFEETVLRQDISGRDRMIKAAKYHG
ncbi:MAG: peptide chain release factor N(5)-glutamine methyltransferase [Bacteroidales bacterium]|jgi:release factor glutamine methyltransferase|nr:peptide chain release factor N(5)-glutamine methyltransferase [Bacteroidota bacterium]